MMKLDPSGVSKTPVIQWEAHACLPLVPGQDMSRLNRYRAAGFHHVSINVGMDMTPFETVIRTIAGFRSWLADHPEDFVLVATADDIYQAHKYRKLAVSFDLEGSNMLLQDPAMVALFASLGVRQMLLAYNRDNSCAGGCHGPGTGLTPLGRKIVQGINTAGIIIDCSHASKSASLEIMEISQLPAIFSHTNVKAVFDHPRTIDDEQIFACAAQGGVIGLTGLGIFLGDPSASIDAYIRQIDYLAERIGTSHIGIGLDTELYPEHKDLPEGEKEEDWWPIEHYGQMNGHVQLQPETLGEVAQQLTRLGYSEADIQAIYGNNFMRIAKATWPGSKAVT
ncbi:membrane dipeptidase [Pseudomonas sp. SWRI18]|uniref:membrane dipeptidase n=1 Tax=Pseudomonas sp. SWRI18 TaxID=2753888 RepID=UPI001EE1569A|nr:membrane dipeptidase [Pseudomonas sp. SWRI18]